MNNEKFAVFILSHGRADRVVTYDALRRDGYTGEIYIIIDNEDDQAEEYLNRYGEKVIIFDKRLVAKNIDVGDNFGKRNCVVFARNECHNIAKKLKLEYFLELDDDYNGFMFRYDKQGKLGYTEATNLDKVFDSMVNFLEKSNALSVCFSQGGDYIGGLEGGYFKKGITRKAMNAFFCKTDRPFQFYGRINEDTTAYCFLGSQGKLFFSVTNFMLNQKATQSNEGGLTDIYLDLGTYTKSFYSVLYMPSAVKVSMMGSKYKRVHHKIKWNNCVPKILDEKYKKIVSISERS